MDTTVAIELHDQDSAIMVCFVVEQLIQQIVALQVLSGDLFKGINVERSIKRILGASVRTSDIVADAKRLVHGF